MSKVWKWILGILIVFVVIAVVVGGVFLVRNQILFSRSIRAMPYPNSQARPNLQGTPNAPGSQNPNGEYGPGMPYGFNNDRRFPFGNRGWGGPMMPMMGGHGFRGFGGFMPFGMGFFFLGGLIRLILPVGVLVLVAFLFYQMGKRAGASTVAPQTPAPITPAPDETPGGGRKVA